MVNTLGLTFSADILFDGMMQGFVYALVAFGLVLIYRATGVINFAHGQIGAFGGYCMALLSIRYDIGYGVSLPLALAAGVVLGVASELILRRLFTQPRLLLFVATLGLTQLIQFLQLRLPIPEEEQTSAQYPVLTSRSWDIGSVSVTGPQLTVLIAVPVIMVFLGWLMQKSRFGMEVRATADNQPSASLAGISVRAVSTKVWALAGLLAALSALLIAPLQGGNIAVVQTALGPKLLLLSLTAAMIGRMRSFFWAAVGGIVVGVIDWFLVIWAQTGDVADGTNNAVVLAILLVLLVTFGRSAAGRDDAWSLAPRVRAAKLELTQHPLYRALSVAGFGLLALLALWLPTTLDKPTDYLRYSTVLVYLIVALSATVLTGWAGQLSLGQFGFVAIGSYMTIYYSHELPYLVSIAIGVAFGVVTAVVLGVPALRIKGLYLAVVTLGFALTIRNWFIFGWKLSPDGAGDPQLEVDRTKGFRLLFWEVKGTDFSGIYYFCLFFVVIAIVLVWRVRRTGIGRSLIAVRDNENTAAAYTVSPTRAKLLAFGLSGGLAALAGGLLPLTAPSGQFRLIPLMFDVEESLRIVAVAVVGGVSSITGAVLGTILIIGIPTVFEGTDQVRLFTSGVGMLIVLLYFPGGLISIIHAARDNLMAYLVRRSGWTPPVRAKGAAVAQLASAPSSSPAGAAPLVTHDVTVRFGGRLAVDNVSIRVDDGEIVGLIGTNGAGKTTLMNAVSGFVPSTGRIELYGRDVGSMTAHRRSRLGLGRAFQNAKLFGSLTARETIMVALEARQRSLLVPSIFALPPSPMAERRKRKQADEIISYLGLGRYADSLLGELSTGTRRIVELGSLIALDTKLILLDEPTAGVAQKETEAFGPLIKAIRADMGASILIIEHDMPMVMSISDRIYCLEAGAVIAHGSPNEVRNDPAVIASYLGTDERAIQRSGTAQSPSS